MKRPVYFRAEKVMFVELLVLIRISDMYTVYACERLPRTSWGISS